MSNTIIRLGVIARPVLAIAFLFANELAAQAVGSIRGRVVEAGSGRPVGEVQVYLEGGERRAISDAGGNYVLSNVAPGRRIIRTRRVGFAPESREIDVVPATPVTVDLALRTAVISLDEIVVTGVPTAISKRTLGNSITTIDASNEVAKTATLTVPELLAARAPGVTVLQSSGTPGAGGTVRIRGIGSVTGATAPVVYIDGVRVASGAAGNFRNSWRGPSASISTRSTGDGQDASLLGNLNPEDIESLEVIKGPAAATLYGADAANGVIQIITKRGTAGEQKPQWRARMQVGESNWALDKRSNYTTCTAPRIAAGAAAWPGCVGQAPGTVLTYSGLSQDGVLRGGRVSDANLSLTGGGNGFSYFTAVTQTREQGVVTNSEYGLKSGRANFAFYPTERLNFSVNVGYSQSNTRLPMGDDGAGLLQAAWSYVPGRVLSAGQQVGFAAGSPIDFSVYDNRIRTDRTTVGTTFDVNPFSWFSNRIIAGVDLTEGQANRYIAPGSLWAPNEGQMTQGQPRNRIYTLNYAGTINTPFPLRNSLTSTLSFGAQYTNTQFRNTISQGNDFASATVRDINLAAIRTGWSEYVDVKGLGFFVQEQVGWADKLFLTGALRIDNSSVFGDNIERLIYPKLSVSYVISDEQFMQRFGFVDNLKLRAAWGQAGNSPDPFAAVRSYTLVTSVDPSGNRVSALVPASLGNPDVKPERGSEIELGFDANIRDRFGIEFTYYDKRTRDALMAVPNEPSSGFPGSTYRNVGLITNKGLELAFTASPFSGERFAWDSRLGFSANKNRLERFGFSTTPIQLGITTYNQQYAEGYPLGGFWVHDPVLDAGTGAYVAGPARFLGAADPVREVSFGNTVTLFRNVRLYGLVDYKGGFYVTNQTEWSRCTAGVCEELNDPAVSAERKAMLVANLAVNDALYTQPGDFIKLRDLSLSYDLPPAMFQRMGVQRAALQIAGHNLAILWKKGYKGLDPEVNMSGTNGPGLTAWNLVRTDLWTMPMTRRVTLSMDLAF